MTTGLRAAAQAAERERRVAESKLARQMFSDLMSMTPEPRRAFMRELAPADHEQLLRAARAEAGAALAMYVDDPVGFVEDVLDETLWSKSREVLQSVADHQVTAVPSCFGSSKCVEQDEVLHLADGQAVRAGDLVGTEFTMMGWAEDGTQTPRRAWADWNAYEPVWRLTTESGRTVVRNGHHPLWAADYARVVRSGGTVGTASRVPTNIGWRALVDLRPKDLVLVPETVHARGGEPIGTHRAVLMGYLLGDGGTTCGVNFTQCRGSALDEFKEAVTAAGARFVIRSKLNEVERLDVYGYRAPGAQHFVNPVLNLVREWGMDCRAKDKRLPAQAWTLPNDELALVLGRLFACDGYATMGTARNGARNATIGMTLASEGLVRDFQRAMLRFGVAGRVTAITARANGKDFPAWRWTVTDAAGIARFRDAIAVPGKDDRIAEVAAHAAGRRHAQLWRHREAPEGYRWEKVASIEDAGVRQTVAITVDVDHTWVDLLVEHNTWGAARATLWWTMVHAPGTALAVTIAPLWRQVVRQMWPEIRKAHARAHLPGSADTFQMKLRSSDGQDVVTSYGLVANKNDESSTQGIHSPHLLLVVDEAGGISETIGKNFRALMTGNDSRMLAIGNPPTDDEGGWFEKLCTGGIKMRDVNTITISAYDSPELSGEVAPRCKSCPSGVPAHSMSTHLVDRDWVENTLEEFGEDSPFTQAKLYARFPQGAGDKALPTSWVELATKAETPEVDPEFVTFQSLGLLDDETDPAEKVQMGAWIRLGVDVAAGGGDELVVARAAGDLLELRHTSSGPTNADAAVVAGKILAEIKSAQRLAKKVDSPFPVRVKIDAIGVGWGVAGMLEDAKARGLHQADIVKIVVSEGTNREPDPKATFRPRIKRDEMWLAFRDLLPRPGEVQPAADEDAPPPPRIRLRLRDKNKTFAQLTAPGVTVSRSLDGSTVVESKDDLKKRGKNSPDRAEALLLSVYEPAPPAVKRKKVRVLVN